MSRRWYGCYEGLQCGMTTRALQDLTGGIVQSFGLSSQDRYLTFQVLNSAVPRSSLLIACIQPVGRAKKKLHTFFVFLFTYFFFSLSPRPLPPLFLSLTLSVSLIAARFRRFVLSVAAIPPPSP